MKNYNIVPYHIEEGLGHHFYGYKIVELGFIFKDEKDAQKYLDTHYFDNGIIKEKENN